MAEQLSNTNENAKKPKRIAMYVIYDKDGILDGFRKYYLRELRKVCDTIVGVVSGTLTPESRAELEELTDDFFVRENKGLLAGSWIDGIAHIGWDKLEEYDELLMLNDSFFGPFFPLQDMMDAAEKSNADFYGATRNFENKEYREMWGRQLRHGHFMGSISYFYIIKRRLLHSNEFRSYWSQHPDVKEDYDTYFFAEIDFFDYVRDAGFIVDAYQTDKLKNYFPDNLTHNMVKLLETDKVPFARIRPFATDMKDQSMHVGYGRDPRLTLEYIDKHTDYDINLIWDYILRTKNLTDIFNQLQLEYVLPLHSLERPYSYKKRIAVILHIYYEDLVDNLVDYCLNFPAETDFYVTAVTDKTREKIIKAFSDRGLNVTCVKRPNVGVAMSTLWITYANVVLEGNYEYICYFHDKKSPYSTYEIQGEQFAERCYQNLFGSRELVENIINLFEDNPRMGLIGVPCVYHGDYFAVATGSWGVNYQNTVDLAKELDIRVNISSEKTPVAPYGDMFWFRSTALSKAIGHGYTYDDFNIEYKPDGTKLHAIERIYAFAVQDAGYYYAEVLNSDYARSDLINFQYMVHQYNEIFLKLGYYPYNYNYSKQILQCVSTAPSFRRLFRIKVKGKIKRMVSPKLWEKLRTLYHKMGGKRWIG